MSNKLSIHHIAPDIVEKQLSGHSYAVPALCEAIAHSMDTHMHVVGNNNLVFTPSFKVHEYKANPFLKFILSSKECKLGLKRLIKRGDIIHTHGAWRMPHIYSLDVKKEKAVKIINSPKGSFSKEALKISKYKKALFSTFSQQNTLLSSCNAFHATSIKEKGEIRSLGFKQPIGIIPEGIDLPDSKKFTRSAKKIKFLYLGRIHPIKGLDLLIKTWSRIEAENQNCSLEICGYYDDVNYFNSLKNLIEKLNLKTISFSDSVYGEQKSKKYFSNDVFILPSKSENFALVIAEAMSHEMPVITSENTPWDIVKKNNYGWVISLNEDSIYSAVSTANSLPERKLLDMGVRGKKYIKDNLSWDVLSNDYLTFYDWVQNGGEIPSFVDIF